MKKAAVILLNDFRLVIAFPKEIVDLLVQVMEKDRILIHVVRKLRAACLSASN